MEIRDPIARHRTFVIIGKHLPETRLREDFLRAVNVAFEGQRGLQRREPNAIRAAICLAHPLAAMLLLVDPHYPSKKARTASICEAS